MHISANKRDTKERRVSQRTPDIDAIIGEEEQMKKKEKETGSGTPTKIPWIIWLPLTTRMDHMVSQF